MQSRQLPPSAGRLPNRDHRQLPPPLTCPQRKPGPGSEQCCQGADDEYAEFESPYCARAGQECCPWDFEDGACGAGENCCPPDLAIGGEQNPGCIPEDAVCCPFASNLSIGAASSGSSGRGSCEGEDFCCPPIAGVVEGRCCPVTFDGSELIAGTCCDPTAADPDAACPDDTVCQTFEERSFDYGCCVSNTPV